MNTSLILVLILIVAFATSLQAASHNGQVSQGHYKKGQFQKHKELSGVDAKIIAVIKKLRGEQSYQVRLINQAKKRRDRARAARKQQLRKTQAAHSHRVRKENQYNNARQNEERQQAKLKVKQAQHRAAQKAYYRQHKVSSHAIKQLDAELKIMNKIRYFLGAHRQTGWRAHKAHRGVRRNRNIGFKSYKNKKSTFHHGKQRFYKKEPFHISTKPMNYISAVKYCKARGQQLGQINSAAYNRKISAVLKRRRIHVWIGINDIAKEGRWVWQNGQLPKYSHWHKGEPNNHGRGEDCAMMYYHLSRKANEGTAWNDISCTARYYALCN